MKKNQIGKGQRRSLHKITFLVACSSHFINLGLCDVDESPASKHAAAVAAETQTRRTGGTGSMIVIAFVVVVVFSFLSFLLFKLWQKKKREEQYAQLLKLFEEDDELELELGLRD